MKRIICTVTNDLNSDQRMIRICSTLVDAGYDVTLVGWVRGNGTPLREKIYRQKRFHLFFTKGKMRYIEYNFRLFFWLLFRKVDILNAIDLDTLFANFLVKTIRRKPLVYDAHEYFIELPELVQRPKTRAIWKVLGDYCIPKIEYNYTVCQSLSNIFKEIYQREFAVIRNVPFRKETPIKDKKNDKRKVILYQGWLNLGRGLPEMITAMQFIDAEFWLAGDGDITDELKKQVEQMNLQDKVKFLGKLHPEKLWTVTCQAYIGINLLENLGLNNYYSLANKTFDYIQANIPALHMDFPEYRVINEQYEIGILLSKLNSDTLVNAINRLLNNADLYSKLVENTRKAAIELNWENESRKLIEIYQKIG